MTFQEYRQSADYILNRSGGFCPEVLIILGSGLGAVAEMVEDAVVIPYQDIPHAPVSTAPGHAGNLVLGRLNGKNVAVMQGRMHFYEGYTPEQVPYLVRVCYLTGARKMIITNACGGINEKYHVGDLMLIRDFMKFTDTNVLTGPNLPEFGERFPDMCYVFTPEYRAAAKQAAADMGIAVQEGVYCYFTGPQYETPAEIRAARLLGADAAGMSTVPECIAAAHAGMKILGISLITNMAAGVLDQPLCEEEVLESAEKAKPYFSTFLLECLKKI